MASKLKRGKVEGVVVVSGVENEPFSIRASISRTKGELLLAQQSKYLMAPLDEVIKEIIHSKDNYAPYITLFFVLTMGSTSSIMY